MYGAAPVAGRSSRQRSLRPRANLARPARPSRVATAAAMPGRLWRSSRRARPCGGKSRRWTCVWASCSRRSRTTLATIRRNRLVTESVANELRVACDAMPMLGPTHSLGRTESKTTACPHPTSVCFMCFLTKQLLLLLLACDDSAGLAYRECRVCALETVLGSILMVPVLSGSLLATRLPRFPPTARSALCS